jgi:UDP-N-acetylmuramoylalanine--D-glutamate ligase
VKLILGCGLTGLSVANYLVKNNEKFIIADSRKTPPQAKNLPKCKSYFGDWQLDILNGVTQIIISPGISPDEKIIQWATKKNIAIISDIDLFYENIKNQNKTLIGITGSNGKSTTTKLLEFVLQKLDKKAIACGNIGVPVLDIDFAKYDTFVMELSSYQLDIMQNAKFDFGTILNITPDHIERYKTIENYTNSKLKIHKISKNIIDNDWTIKVPKDNQFGVLNCHGGKFVIFNDEVILDYKDCKLIGEHNLENILATFSFCHKLKLDLKKVSSVICKFKGLEHRLEFVKNIKGCDYYNDSKATNSVATIIAIKSLQNKYKNITLILGGVKKDEDYFELINLINNRVNQVVLIGESTDFFAKNIKITTIVAKKFADVLLIDKSDCVLFSPACASFDMFDNFEQRGYEFKKLLNLKN